MNTEIKINEDHRLHFYLRRIIHGRKETTAGVGEHSGWSVHVTGWTGNRERVKRRRRRRRRRNGRRWK
jgi:hypothetical protein